AIDPLRSGGTATVTLTVTGDFFQQNAVVSLIGGDNVQHDMPTTFVSATSLTAVVSGLQDGVFAVKVTNPDTQTDTFFAYEQTNSSAGHLNSGQFTLAGGQLTIKRERHGAVEGFDIAGQAHLYVVGGMDQTKTVLDSVESAA